MTTNSIWPISSGETLRPHACHRSVSLVCYGACTDCRFNHVRLAHQSAIEFAYIDGVDDAVTRKLYLSGRLLHGLARGEMPMSAQDC